jgi:hypothetical protein
MFRLLKFFKFPISERAGKGKAYQPIWHSVFPHYQQRSPAQKIPFSGQLNGIE